MEAAPLSLRPRLLHSSAGSCTLTGELPNLELSTISFMPTRPRACAPPLSPDFLLCTLPSARTLPCRSSPRANQASRGNFRDSAHGGCARGCSFGVCARAGQAAPAGAPRLVPSGGSL